MSKNIHHFSPAGFTFSREPWSGGPGIAPDTTELTNQDVTVHLSDLKQKVLEWLSKQRYVFACIAWLSDEDVIAAINSKKIAQVVMQKEDWLRPDGDYEHPGKSKGHLFTMNAGFARCEFDKTQNLSFAAENSSAGRYRVFGVSTPDEKRLRRPVMHHKFIVGATTNPHACDDENFHEPNNDDEWEIRKKCPDCEREQGKRLVPTSVWVGSYNMSRYAHRNMDSALVLGPAAAEVYLEEWADIFANSEPLDFKASWVEPEWRVGS